MGGISAILTLASSFHHQQGRLSFFRRGRWLKTDPRLF